jgi:hypothetical protein
MTLVLAALLVVLATWFGAIWIGWNLLGRPAGAHDDPIVLGWIGWYVQALAVLLSGMAGLLDVWWLGALVVLPVAGALLDRNCFFGWWGAAWQEYLTIGRESGWMLLLVVAALLCVVLQITVPVFFYDTLFYGFGQPMHWLGEGRIHTAAADNFAYLSVPPRMHFLWGLGLIGEPLPSLGLAAAVVAATLLVGRMLARHLDLAPRWCALGMAAVALTPSLWELTLLRKDDLYAVTGAAVLLTVLLDWRRHPEGSRRRVIVLSLVTAVLVAVKQPHTLGYAACAWVLAWWSRPDRLSRGWWRAAVGASVLSILLVMPWFVYAWVDSGHPATGARPYLADRELSSSRWAWSFNHAEPFWSARRGGLAQDLMFHTTRFYRPQEWGAAGNMGLLLLLLVPLAVVLGRQPGLQGLWIGGFAGWYLTIRLLRFVTFLVPLSVVLVISLLHRRLGLRLATTLVVVSGLVNLGVYVVHPVTGAAVLNHGPVPVGIDTDLVLYPPSIEICETANRSLPEGSRLIFIGESRSYPCRVPFEYWNPHFVHPFEKVRAGEPPEATWARHVLDHGVTHAVYSPSEVRRLFEVSPRLAARLDAWLQRTTRVLASRGPRGMACHLLEFRMPALAAATADGDGPGGDRR